MRYCTVKDCNNKHACKDLCSKHYMRVLKNGTLTTKFEMHGMKGTAEYGSWQAMKRRCNYTKDSHYTSYGGRGINVCKEWANSFSTFYKDMGAKPTTKHTLDRIDNEKGYSPDNCRWASPHEQASNKRNNNKVVGVCKDANGGWVSSLNVAGVRVFRKWFSTYEDAVKARLKAEAEFLHNA